MTKDTVNGENYYDAIVVGAGFSGMKMLHLLREQGYSVRLIEAGESVGGTWYWNRYPGARSDFPTEYYCFTGLEEVNKEWSWTSQYPGQPEILSYFNFVADKLELRKDIQFNTRLTSATYDEAAKRWTVGTDDGHQVNARFFIPALGNVAIANWPEIDGLQDFAGEIYHTSRWPHEKVDLSGKRVAVIGTGSTGVQVITTIADEVEHLTVFQRTPQYVTPVSNRAHTVEEIDRMKGSYGDLQQRIRSNITGAGFELTREYSALDDSPEERARFYEEMWNKECGIAILLAYNDIGTDPEANKTLSDFARGKIREIVKDPETAEKLIPTYPYGGKRPVVGMNYYETYNHDHVSLVSLQETPIVNATTQGLVTSEEEHEFDVIIVASGFDAFTGALTRADIRGRGGVSIGEKWDNGNNLMTYLGVHHSGFPNLFTITGPHFPVTVNAFAIDELMAEWILTCMKHADAQGVDELEPTKAAETAWTNHVNEIGSASIHAGVESWYRGANVEGKGRAFYGYSGEFLTFQEWFKNAEDFTGFTASESHAYVGASATSN